ncbi:MAG: hypothetical protein IBX57_00910 [Gammaproteobacteria bacterium]|nr:hypothetical protein [Gammaproteobacteria bacterium]
MLVLPQTTDIYRILSIDPGTATTGVAILDLNLVTNTVDLIFVDTIKAGRGYRKFDHVEDVHGGREAKLQHHFWYISDILFRMQPNCVISESPYMGRFAQAFEALVECLYVVKTAIMSYDPSMPLETIDPPNVKKAVGASGRGGDKDAVRKALYNLKGLTNRTGISLDSLDEHSIDAIAVGCYKLRTISDDIIK